MKRLQLFTEKTKNQPIDIWFFFLFLLSLTLSVRKVLFYFPIKGAFNEYSGIYLYLSDIFLFIAIALWLISLLYNTYSLVSNIKLWISSLFKQKIIVVPLFLVIWSFASIFWSQNQVVAFFRSIKLFEFYLLYVYVIFRIVPQLFHVEHPSSKMLNCSTLAYRRGRWNNFIIAIIFSGLAQAILGIAQFIAQKSLGLTFLKESILNSKMPGVAKIIINGEKHIRAYGLFPHPNILGGFLLFSIILTLYYIRLRQKATAINIDALQCKEECSTWNINYNKTGIIKYKNISLVQVNRLPTFSLNCSTPACRRGRWNNFADFKDWLSKSLRSFYFFSKKLQSESIWLIYLFLFLQIFSFLTSFSKSAIFGLIIAIGYLYVPHLFHKRNKNKMANKISFGMGKFRKMTHFVYLSQCIFASVVILAASVYMLNKFEKIDLNAFLVVPAKERMFYLNVPRGTIYESPIFGVGAGQSILVMQDYFQKALETYEYQPVHNVYLLIWSDLGVIGLILFLLILWHLFRASPVYSNCSTWNNCFRAWVKHPELYFCQDKSYQIVGEDIIVPRGTIISWYLKSILLGFSFIMLFDHYFWDIQQGQIIFWLVLGLLAGLSITKNRKVAKKVGRSLF